MLTPSLRSPSRNFGPIVPEAASKHATAELSRLSTGANDWSNDGFAGWARFPPRQGLGSAVRASAQAPRAARGRADRRSAGATAANETAVSPPSALDPAGNEDDVLDLISSM